MAKGITREFLVSDDTQAKPSRAVSSKLLKILHTLFPGTKSTRDKFSTTRGPGKTTRAGENPARGKNETTRARSKDARVQIFSTRTRDFPARG
jgi:hypothetical protein